MTEEHDWSIVFYTTADGAEPVRAFLENLDPRTQIRFEWSIEQLRVRNVRATEPLVKHIEDKIWELRRASDGNIYGNHADVVARPS
jgi:DNA repair photolyase